MDTEIEDKYLVIDDTWQRDEVIATAQTLRQNYFTGNGGHLSVVKGRTVYVEMVDGRVVEAPLEDNSYNNKTLREAVAINGAVGIGAGFEARYRISMRHGRFLSCVLALKRDRPEGGRDEVQFSIPQSASDDLASQAIGREIHKVRFRDAIGNGLWAEIDQFHGLHEGKVTAEVEKPRLDTVYSKPPYFGENISGVPEYSNVYMSLGHLQKGLVL